MGGSLGAYRRERQERVKSSSNYREGKFQNLLPVHLGKYAIAKHAWDESLERIA